MEHEGFASFHGRAGPPVDEPYSRQFDPGPNSLAICSRSHRLRAS